MTSNQLGKIIHKEPFSYVTISLFGLFTPLIVAWGWLMFAVILPLAIKYSGWMILGILLMPSLMLLGVYLMFVRMTFFPLIIFEKGIGVCRATHVWRLWDLRRWYVAWTEIESLQIEPAELFVLYPRLKLRLKNGAQITYFLRPYKYTDFLYLAKVLNPLIERSGISSQTVSSYAHEKFTHRQERRLSLIVLIFLLNLIVLAVVAYKLLFSRDGWG